jgi:hypothetical protein
MFGKIFKSIYYGSLAPNRDARELMIFLCVHADKTGYVDMTLEACGRVLNWPPEDLHRAAEILMAPDPESSQPAEEGRRILARSLLTRGIQIVNYETYRNMQTDEERREYNRNYYLTHIKPNRIRNKESRRVKKDKLSSARSGQAEAEAEADKYPGGSFSESSDPFGSSDSSKLKSVGSENRSIRISNDTTSSVLAQALASRRSPFLDDTLPRTAQRLEPQDLDPIEESPPIETEG